MSVLEVLNRVITILSNVFYEINTKLTPVHATLDSVNSWISAILPWCALTAFAGYDLFYYLKNRRKRDVFPLLMIWFVMQGIMIAAFWILPYLFALYLKAPFWAVGIRWVIFSSAFAGIVYVYGNAYGERRWLYSSLGHLGTLFLGWVINRWAGLLLISLPLLLAYYATLYVLAMITLPASEPEDKGERWKRFLVLVAYTWGVQLPILVVADHAWKKAETRIKGDFARDLPIPGLIWTKSHHIVGITGGTQFNRVAGPGVIFTGKLEQPFQIIDLRLQLRTNEIDVVSKDGVKFIARVFTAFRMDPEEWDENTRAEIVRRNPFLQGAEKPSYTKGSFPFSHNRIQAALCTTSSKSAEPAQLLCWDKWVLNIVGEEARKAVSQRNLNEFWRPNDDQRNANTMNAIAQEIKDRVAPILRAKGILAIVARIVNFKFTPVEKEVPKDEVSKQQLESWGAEWERRYVQIISNAEATAEQMQQAARAEATAQLLDGIADALRQAREINPDLPRQMIALRYLSALQDYAHKNTPQETEKIKELHNALIDQ